MISTFDMRMGCVHCRQEFRPTMPFMAKDVYASFYFCRECENKLIIRPERSKREDSQKCEMRCSEHCGNTVREAQETSSPKDEVAIL